VLGHGRIERRPGGSLITFLLPHPRAVRYLRKP
jgi:hypothetical protein